MSERDQDSAEPEASDSLYSTASAEILRLERAGRLADARDHALRAAADAQAEEQLFYEARLLSRASELTLYTKGAEQAEKVAKEALEKAQALATEQPMRALCMLEARLSLARVYLRHHTETALEQAQELLDLEPVADADADAADDDADEASALGATRLKLLGLAHARRGSPRQALSYFGEAYRQAEGHPGLRARVLLTWAVQLRNWGLFEDARRRAERSLEIRLQLSDHYGAAMCYGTLAFIYQRQGLFEHERDALVADLRLCERIGGFADMPGLHARLAGALIGLGKYAGAWTEAEKAIALENRRRGQEDIDSGATEDEEAAAIEQGTRVHAFAWREMARVCLAQGRVQRGLQLVARAGATFERVRDRYGQALCALTEAQLALQRAREQTSDRDSPGAADSCRQVARALQAAQPTFVRLGAVPEAAETILLHVENEHLQGRGAAASSMLGQQVLPMLQRAGLEKSPLQRRIRECLRRIAPERAIEHTVTRAAMLRSLAAILTEAEPQQGTAVVATVGEEHRAREFALAAVDCGAVVLWPDSERALAVLLGPGHEERARELMAAQAQLPLASATGEIDLEHMWPTGVRARGEPIEAALSALSTVSDTVEH